MLDTIYTNPNIIIKSEGKRLGYLWSACECISHFRYLTLARIYLHELASPFGAFGFSFWFYSFAEQFAERAAQAGCFSTLIRCMESLNILLERLSVEDCGRCST